MSDRDLSFITAPLRRNARPGRAVERAVVEPNERSVAEAQGAVAESKIFATELAILAGNKLFELAGTRSTPAQHALDRHWRNARTHTLHDPGGAGSTRPRQSSLERRKPAASRPELNGRV